MIDNDLGVNIISLFSKNYFDILSINQISKKINKKYPYVHKITHQLITDSYLKDITIGRSILCSANLENPFTCYILNYHHLKQSEKILGRVAKLKVLKQYLQSQRKADLMLIDTSKKNKVICVTDSKIPPSTEKSINFNTLKEKELIDLFLGDKNFYQNHVVCFGFEYFIDIIKKNHEVLNFNYNPLMRRLK